MSKGDERTELEILEPSFIQVLGYEPDEIYGKLRFDEEKEAFFYSEIYDIDEIIAHPYQMEGFDILEEKNKLSYALRRFSREKDHLIFLEGETDKCIHENMIKNAKRTDALYARIIAKAKESERKIDYSKTSEKNLEEALSHFFV